MVSKIDRTPWEGASFQADPSKLCGPMNERNVRVPSLIRVNTRLILEARVQDVEFPSSIQRSMKCQISKGSNVAGRKVIDLRWLRKAWIQKIHSSSL